MARGESIKDKAYRLRARVISWDPKEHKLEHRLERWQHLREPAFIMSPYGAKDTFKFIAGLIEIGELALPQGERDVVLASMEDPSIDEFALSYIAEYQNLGSPVICDLAAMGDVVPRQVMEQGNCKDIPVWTGKVSIIDDYVARKYARKIYANMRAEWDRGAFEFASDRGDTVKNLTKKRCAVLLEALAMGHMDMSEVTKLLSTDYDSSLDNVNGLNLEWVAPDWIVRANKLASDVLILWSYAARRERIRMSIPMTEIKDALIGKRIARLADMLGMESVLDTYAAGVPAADIAA